MKKDLRKKNSYIKIAVVCVSLTMALFFPAVSYALPAGGGFFADDESTNDNAVSASTLDSEVSSTQTELQLPAVAANMLPGNSVSRDAHIDNVGQENFKYRVKFDKVSGSDELCDELEVEAKKNGLTVYNNDLFDFTVNAGTLDSGDDDDWNFIVTLPLGASHNVEGEDCDFNFEFTAWQTDFVGPTEGWIDEEDVTGNETTAGDWIPIISGVENTDPLDTQGATNNDMSKVSVSWSTNESATSNVVYDTVTHAVCAGLYPSAAPAPADATADSTDHEVTLTNLAAGATYYYRAVSEDSGHNVVCSDEYSFAIPSSSADAPSSDIVLNEFVPNPFGVDSDDMPDGEWVELYNKSGADVGVNGWYIYDSTNAGGVQITALNTNTGGTTVSSHGWLVVYINKAYLNNDGDTARLFSGVFGVGILIDSHAYTSAVPEGKSFARFPDGVGVWIDPDATPGEENELGGTELEQFRTAALAECFDALGNVKKSKKDICQAEFLEYIGMLASKKDKIMAEQMMKQFIIVNFDDIGREEIVEAPEGESILENNGTILGDSASPDLADQESDDEAILQDDEDKDKDEADKKEAGSDLSESAVKDASGESVSETENSINEVAEEPVAEEELTKENEISVKEETAPVEEMKENAREEIKEEVKKEEVSGKEEKKAEEKKEESQAEEKPKEETKNDKVKEEMKEEDKKEEKNAEDKPKEEEKKDSDSPADVVFERNQEGFFDFRIRFSEDNLC